MVTTFDVFLSHNSHDKPVVREIYRLLQGRGVRPWLDEEHLIPGRDWQEALEEIIETVPAALICVGENGIGPWEDRETRACLMQYVERKQPVIPVLLPGAAQKPKLPLFLSTLTWVDLRDGFTAKEVAKLLAAIPGQKHHSTPPVPPPLHNLPFESLGDLFKGREAELAELEAFAASSTQKKVLHGLGGIGKTRLAVEHAWRQGGLYSAVFFLRADSPAGLQAQVASLAGADLLRLPERQATEEKEVYGAVLHWLRENPGWLLILDNVDSEAAAQAVRVLLPRLQTGKVLVTSRLAVWPAGLSGKEVDSLSTEDAAAFFLERTAGQRETAPNDEADARQLAERLGALPLALAQACAYIAFHHLPLRGYLEEWERTGKVLDWYDGRGMDYPRSLAVTWQQTPRENGTLTGGPFAPPRPSRAISDPPWTATGRFGEAEPLLRQALDICRETFGEKHPNVAIQLNNLAQLLQDTNRLEEAEPLLRQALDIDKEAFGSQHPKVAIRLNNLAMLLQATDRLREAEPLMQQAFEIFERSLGPDHPQTHIVRRNLEVIRDSSDPSSK